MTDAGDPEMEDVLLVLEEEAEIRQEVWENRDVKVGLENRGLVQHDKRRKQG